MDACRIICLAVEGHDDEAESPQRVAISISVFILFCSIVSVSLPKYSSYEEHSVSCYTAFLQFTLQ